MTFPDAVRSVLSQYAGFRGRAPRSEYWWWYLLTVLVNLATNGIDRLTHAAVGVSFVGVVVTLGLLLPTLAVSVRRLHDSGLSGWWLSAPVGAGLLGVGCLVGGLGSIVAGAFAGNADKTLGLGVALFVAGGLLLLVSLAAMLVLMLRPSTPGPNRFGPASGPPSPYPPTGTYGYGPGYGPAPWVPTTPAPGPPPTADGDPTGPR